MENLIPIFRLSHLLGLSLLLGGSFASIMLLRKPYEHLSKAKINYDLLHLVQAPGLTLLIVTGLLQSSIYSFANFKGAGYMHLKVTLVFMILIFLFFEMRTCKRLIKEKSANIKGEIKKCQIFSGFITILTIFSAVLIGFRPF